MVSVNETIAGIDRGRPGILGSFEAVLAEFGKSVDPYDSLSRVIGPPLRESFRSLLATGREHSLFTIGVTLWFWFKDEFAHIHPEVVITSPGEILDASGVTNDNRR